MALKREEETIDEIRIVTVQLPPIPGAKLQAKLMKIAAPALSGLKGLSESQLDKMLHMDLGALAPVLAGLFSQIDDKLVETLIRETFASSYAVVQDEKGSRKIELSNLDNVNVVFEGKIGAMYKALLFSMKVNFGDFSGGVFSKLRGASEEKAPAPESA